METILKKFRVSNIKPHKSGSIDTKHILDKKIAVLSSHRIKKPINRDSYINIDIPLIPLTLDQDKHKQDFIITFDDIELLNFLKESTNHPYDISHVPISDIIYYIQQSKSNLMILHDAQKHNYTATTIFHHDIKHHTSFDEIPILSIEFLLEKHD